MVVNQGVYTENFNSMGTVTSVYPSGWNGYKVTGNGSLGNGSFITPSTNPQFLASDGSSNTDTIYNFGTTGNTDRALGSVAGPQTTAGFGLVLVNNTGRTLTAADVALAFRAEQWRTGSANTVNEALTFEYRTGNSTLDVNDPSSVGWTQVSGLNINEIQTSASGAGPIDGNLVGNFTNVAGTLNGLIWNPGDRLVIRWLDNNDQGSDAGMAIDNFSFTVFAPVPEPTTFATAGASLAGFLFYRRRSLIS